MLEFLQIKQLPLNEEITVTEFRPRHHNKRSSCMLAETKNFQDITMITYGLVDFKLILQ